VERLLAYFSHSPRTHLRISPQSIAEPAIGHFGFFNSRFEQKLWQLPLEWLKSAGNPVSVHHSRKSGVSSSFLPEKGNPASVHHSCPKR
jgi:hypothetical protein